MTPEEIRKKEEERRKQSKIAQSRIQATPIVPAGQTGLNPGQPGQSPLGGIGKQLLGSALGAATGGISSAITGLFGFNKGGGIPMQGYNTGGQTNRFGRKVTKPARTKTSSQGGGWWGSLFGKNKKNMGGAISPDTVVNGQFMSKHTPQFKNVGGPLANPKGYNEGGQNMETPLKRVMDEDKIELARMAAMNAERRKDEKFKLDEKRAAEKHTMDMKMKKKASVTNKAPLAKKS